MDGHRYGVFTHDWRVEPVAAWEYRIENLQLGLQSSQMRETAVSFLPLLTLSQPEFTESVRQALRDYTRIDLLAQNPLMRSKLVAETARTEPAEVAAATPTTLQKLLQDAAATLTGNPKDEKFYTAVYHTYFKPAPSQEA